MADADASPDPAVTAQRIQRRMADLADAQVHATLAPAAVIVSPWLPIPVV